MEEIKFDYDDKSDSLFIFREGGNVKGSVELGDFIIDLDSNMNKVLGLEILNASKNLPLQLSKKVNKTTLSNIKKAFLRTQHKDNIIYVIYGIYSEYKDTKLNEETFIPVPISVHPRAR